MSRDGQRITLRLAPWAVLLTVALAASGCQLTSHGDNLVNGKKLFIGEARCGSCHSRR